MRIDIVYQRLYGRLPTEEERIEWDIQRKTNAASGGLSGKEKNESDNSRKRHGSAGG